MYLPGFSDTCGVTTPAKASSYVPELATRGSFEGSVALMVNRVGGAAYMETLRGIEVERFTVCRRILLWREKDERNGSRE